jgi:uncharacterized protein (TIGR03382 family)
MRISSAVLLLVLLPGAAEAATQCFSSGGTYGALTVTATGTGCGTFLSYSGIYGVWMGNSSTTEACTFTMSTASGGVDQSTLTVDMTAHSNVSGAVEEAEFELNGTKYSVTAADIDNSSTTGEDLYATSSGRVGGVLSTSGGNGVGTVSFGSTSTAVTSLEINHIVLTGSPNGTIYRVCVDDGGVTTVDADGDGYPSSSDCDDSDPSVYPGATERCNGKDDDCDGTVDEPDAVDAATWYADDDGDGYGDPLVTTRACDEPSGYVADATDCWDASSAVHPGATELPDGVDGDCDGDLDEGTDYADDDGDGFSEEGGDCDDGAADVSPAAVESCDGVDEDCDGTTDEGTACSDDDGDGLSEDDGDCNDGAAAVNPDATEAAGNGVDDDCNGIVDDSALDEDGDGYASGDCDPTDGDVYPGAPEVADGEDQDCDDVVDEGTPAYDDDGDGFTEVDGDCDDTDAGVNPSEGEAADGVDEDCDGTIDEGTTRADDDGDGFTEEGGDCDDADATVSPGAAELDDDLDNDCDGEPDDGVDDRDGDGFTEDEGDCDDDDGWFGPLAYEACDGFDNNCNGEIDEGGACADGNPLPAEPSKCGCATGPAGSLPLALLALLAIRRRRSG